MIKVLLHQYEGTGLYEPRMARVYKDHDGYLVEFYNNAVKVSECRVRSSERLAEDIADNWALGDVELNYEEAFDIIFTPEPDCSNDP